jgi:hypothetical protein
MKTGDKIRIIQMNDPFPVPPGTIGIIKNITKFPDGNDLISVDWENNRKLGVVVNVDKFEILTQSQVNILDMSKEYDDMGGCVSCEMSIHKDQLADLAKFVKENVSIKLGEWVVCECPTCVEQHGEHYIHLSIDSHNDIIKNSSALVKLSEYYNESDT